SQQSRGPSEGYSYPVCTTCGRRDPGECRRAAGTCFKCGQAGHLQKECKKNTTASTSGQADKKPGASSRVFAITEDHATKTSGTITGTLFIYGHAVFVLFDTGATHSVISSVFALRVTTTPTLLDHNTMLRSTVVHIELSLVTFIHLSLFIMVPYWENLCRSFPLCKHKEDSEIWTIVENLDKQVEFCLDDDNGLWQGTRLCVPNDARLRETLLTEAHSS
nr:hypothetical protein [Tanacetum cinerariifolium]